MLLNIFGVHTNPFYKFGDIIFLNKISSDNWVKFITETFDRTGKNIPHQTAKKIADMVSMHPYYVQQLAQQAWLRTEDVCSDAIVEDAFEGIIGQLNLLFCNLLDSLTAKQVQFLKAIGNGEKNFTSENVLKQYKLGTSANVKNLKEACIKKDIIDVEPGNTIVFQDPMFECWLRRQ